MSLSIKNIFGKLASQVEHELCCDIFYFREFLAAMICCWIVEEMIHGIIMIYSEQWTNGKQCKRGIHFIFQGETTARLVEGSISDVIPAMEC